MQGYEIYWSCIISDVTSCNLIFVLNCDGIIRGSSITVLLSGYKIVC